LSLYFVQFVMNDVLHYLTLYLPDTETSQRSVTEIWKFWTGFHWCTSSAARSAPFDPYPSYVQPKPD
jgi:hypothetical protein